MKLTKKWIGLMKWAAAVPVRWSRGVAFWKTVWVLWRLHREDVALQSAPPFVGTTAGQMMDAACHYAGRNPVCYLVEERHRKQTSGAVKRAVPVFPWVAQFDRKPALEDPLKRAGMAMACLVEAVVTLKVAVANAEKPETETLKEGGAGK
jgi:hypothetical protein